MNYKSFLNEVDQHVSTRNADSLRLFIHEMARTVPEDSRIKFMSMLKRFCKDNEIITDKKHADKKVEKTFEKKVDSLITALQDIQEGRKKLESECNEDWDDWYHNDEDEYVFHDPDGIRRDLKKALEVLHQCLDRANYEKGALLARSLAQTKVSVSGDYDDEEMSYSDLVIHKLLSVDIGVMVTESLYLTCMGTNEEDRAESMLKVMDDFDYYSVTLDKILQVGTDEIDLESLLPLWIKALARRPANKTDKLLTEAQNMLTDKNAVLEMADNYAESHPVLYLNLLRTGCESVSSEELLRVGLKGIQNIPVSSMVRSEVALLTAEYALSLKDRQTVEDCWLEAFRSNPSIVNFLRLRVYSLNWEKYADSARDIYTLYSESKDQMSWHWDRKMLAVLMFFDGRFDEMVRRFMTPKDGTDSSLLSLCYMDKWIPFQLMLMNVQSNLQQGLSEMLDKLLNTCSFYGKAFCQGTDLNRELSNKDLFLDCFKKWKSDVLLPESTCESWLAGIDSWIKCYVSDIMEHNERTLYDNCAAFIAAYGEVLESRGNSGEKQRIMEYYKMEYHRRRAFHESLKRFGML